MRNKVLKYTVSVLLTVSVLCSSFSVFAVDPTPTPSIPPYDEGLTEVDEKLMSYYIWLCMRAWGINISYEDSVEFNNNIESQIFNWVLEYLADLPSAYSINQWIAPWQSSFDYWGNYRFNSSALEDIQDFVDWLLDKFGLTDNQQIVIEPIYTIGGYTVYNMYEWYSADFSITNPNTISYVGVMSTENGSNVSTKPYYIVADDPVSDKVAYIFFYLDLQSAPQSMSSAVHGMSSTGSDVWLVGNSNNRFNLTYNVWWNYMEVSNNLGSGEIAPIGNHPVISEISYNTIYQFWAQNDHWSIAQEGDMQFLTGDIVLPSDTGDYTPGDSITIIGDNPEYSVIEWNGEVTVSNLPAVVSTGTVENPGIVEFFRPISALIDMAKTPFEIMVQIIYRFPVEVNVCIMSLMGAICLFGIIKIMREH